MSIVASPCNALFVNLVSLVVIPLCAALYYRRQEQRSRWWRSPAILGCDVTKYSVAMFATNALFVLHEIYVDDAGDTFSPYFIVAHELRFTIDILVANVCALPLWRFVNLIAGRIIAGRDSDGLRADEDECRCGDAVLLALQISGRYNPYLLPSHSSGTWDATPVFEADDGRSTGANDLRIDFPPSEAADDEQRELLQLRPYRTLWAIQTAVWSLVAASVASILIGVQLLWREALGIRDPLVMAIEQMIPQDSPALVCGYEGITPVKALPLSPLKQLVGYALIFPFEFIAVVVGLVVVDRFHRHDRRRSGRARVGE